MQARLLRGEFSVVLGQLAANDVQADAILLDLGVSSMQLDRPERGFSYAADAPLDMRMDASAELSARDLVNEADERELALIFRRYGEERYARQIARAIVRRRGRAAVRAHGRPRRDDQAGDPDAGPLRRRPPGQAGLPGAPDRRQRRARRARGRAARRGAMLRPGGRLAVISFHSLEDRIVKRFFREQARGCTCPPDFPICVCGNEPVLRELTRKPVRPVAARARGEPARGARRSSAWR